MSTKRVLMLTAGCASALLGLRTDVRADAVSLKATNGQVEISESVAELARRGRHFDAMAKFSSGDGDFTLADQLGAAKSAWALGLVDRARKIWDDVLASKEFQGDERNRTVLARAIVELQESNFEEARAIAERAANVLETSDLRAQFWLVIAEALKEQNANSVAEGYYKRAIHDGSRPIQTEARFLLGECQRKLGMLNDARYSYASVESGSPYTLQALRRLVELDLAQRNYEGVLTWITEGREAYSGDFKDGWLSYASIIALSETGRTDEAKKELVDFRVRRSERDPWYTMAEAALESKLVTNIYPDERALTETSVIPAAARDEETSGE